MLDTTSMHQPAATETRAANLATLGVYRRFRGAIIGAAAMEDRLWKEASWYDNQPVRDEGSLERLFARQAVEGATEAMEDAISALDALEACMPQEVMRDPSEFETRVRAHLSVMTETAEAAIQAVKEAGGVAGHFAEIRRDLTARRDGYRLGPHLIAARDGKLSDIFGLREAIRRNPEVSPADKFKTPTNDPGPSAVILCLLGIAGAVACVIGLAVTIAVVNPSHGVE